MPSNLDGIEVKLHGLKDVRAALNDLKDYMPKQALRSALRKGAKRMYDAVLAVVPFDSLPRRPGHLGHLRDNISIATRARGAYTRARLVISTVGKRGDPKNSFYWRFLEKGWTDKGGTHHLHPFAERVIEAHAAQAAQDCVDAVDQSITRAENKARKAGVPGI